MDSLLITAVVGAAALCLGIFLGVRVAGWFINDAVKTGILLHHTGNYRVIPVVRKREPR